ncbi:MAG: hypothetical protein ACYC6Y_15240 [Thermoguttaceae bacterium]
MDNGTEPIADDELLFRRVPLIWYDQIKGVSPQAFQPRKDDRTGISVSRRKYTPPNEAARGRPGNSYYLAVLRAGDLRQIGVQIEPRPLSGNPGHAEVVSMNAGNRKATETIERQSKLVELCREVLGPFDGAGEGAAEAE